MGGERTFERQRTRSAFGRKRTVRPWFPNVGCYRSTTRSHPGDWLAEKAPALRQGGFLYLYDNIHCSCVDSTHDAPHRLVAGLRESARNASLRAWVNFTVIESPPWVGGESDMRDGRL
jgi:hypothetical protein